MPPGGIVWLFSRACLSENVFIRAVSGYFAAAFFLPLVAAGMHHGLVALYSVQLAELGFVTLYPALAMAGAGQVGAALALWRKAKKVGNDNLCSVISGALPAGLLGVGEPLIYGVTLPLGKPFLTAGLGAGFGGAFIMVTQVASTTWGPSGLLGAFVMTAGPGGSARSVLLYLTALVISYIGGYLITNIFYQEEELSFETSVPDEQTAAWRSASFRRLSRKKSRPIRAGEPLLVPGEPRGVNLPLTAPVGGETVPMKQIPDIMFSSGVIGSCIGILPESGQILAPCDGTVQEIADTNHALTFRTDEGMEILLHVGIDTFTLGGEGLNPLVQEGETVTRGQPVGSRGRASRNSRSTARRRSRRPHDSSGTDDPAYSSRHSGTDPWNSRPAHSAARRSSGNSRACRWSQAPRWDRCDSHARSAGYSSTDGSPSVALTPPTTSASAPVCISR